MSFYPFALPFSYLLATFLRRYGDGCMKVHLYSPHSPFNIMVIIVEVDCFRRLDAGMSLPDDDLIAEGMIPAQIHASRMAQIAEARTASGFTTSFPNNHMSIQPEDCSDSEADMYVRRLSTITERTEKTEYTEIPARSLRSVSYSGRRNTRAPSSTSDSSYGQVIGKPHLNASFCSSCLCLSHYSCKSSFRSDNHTH